MPAESQTSKPDIRIYIGLILFRWQIIVLCFLYCLLGGVLYIQFCPKQYSQSCKVLIYRDPLLEMGPGAAAGELRSISMHTFLMQDDKVRERVARKLREAWGEKMGSFRKMVLPVSVDRERGFGQMLNVSVKSGDPAYGQAFLGVLLEEHQRDWDDIQKQSTESVTRMLETELTRLEEKIKSAEDDVIEYRRLNDAWRVEGRASIEGRYLMSLMERRSMLSTEMMLMEAQLPLLKNLSPDAISDVARLTIETGSKEPIADITDEEASGKSGGVRESKVELPAALKGEARVEDRAKEESGWRDLRVRLLRAQQKEKELAAYLKPEHPEMKSVQDQIGRLKADLEVAAEVEVGRMKDRYNALKTHLGALEAAEYKWKAQNLLAIQRQAEFKRVKDVVGRFENNYRTLYARLHDMRVSEELKAEHFRVVDPPSANPYAVWPDPMKVLLVSLVLGLGLGAGLSIVAQVFDNKVQSIGDVEKDLGVPFLGGVPFWVHSGLEKTIRPIVTEEHSTGAVEAYRALRTTLLAALGRVNEKIVFFSSADSREGKTLTALNIAILIAQMNKRVLLVDMDLRRGRLHRSLGLEREPGVTDILKTGRPLKDVILKTRIENLSLAPSGSTVENSAELLQSSDVTGMFVGVQDDYDYIFVDTSPVLRVTDTVILATQGLGVVVYVTRVNRTPKPMIRYSLDLLKDARILGMIVNSIEMHRISSLYYAYQYPSYAYYSNAYAYGFDYYYYGDHPSALGMKFRRRHGRMTQARRSFTEWMRNTFLPSD